MSHLGESNKRSLLIVLLSIFSCAWMLYAAYLGFNYSIKRLNDTILFATLVGIVIFPFLLFYWFALKSKLDAYSEVLIVILVLFAGICARILTLYIFKGINISDFDNAYQNYLWLQSVKFEDKIYLPSEALGSSNYYASFKAWFFYFVTLSSLWNIFGFSFTVPIIFNIVLYIISAVLIFNTVKMYYKFAGGLVALAMFSFYPPLVDYVGLSTPDLPQIMFVCLGLFYLSKSMRTDISSKKIILFSAISGAALAFTDMYKESGIVFVIAFFCAEILHTYLADIHNIPQIISKNWKRQVAFVCAFIVCFNICNFTIDLLRREILHVESADIYSSFSTLASGFSANENGEYDASIVKNKFKEISTEYKYDNSLKIQAYSEFSKQLIKENWRIAPSIWLQKFSHYFSEITTFNWSTRHLDSVYSSAFLETVEPYGRNISIIAKAFIYLLAGLSLILLVLRKKHNLFVTFLLFRAMGYILVLLLGAEPQERYIINQFGEICILAAIGFIELIDFVCAGAKKLEHIIRPNTKYKYMENIENIGRVFHICCIVGLIFFLTLFASFKGPNRHYDQLEKINFSPEMVNVSVNGNVVTAVNKYSGDGTMYNWSVIQIGESEEVIYQSAQAPQAVTFFQRGNYGNPSILRYGLPEDGEYAIVATVAEQGKKKVSLEVARFKIDIPLTDDIQIPMPVSQIEFETDGNKIHCVNKFSYNKPKYAWYVYFNGDAILKRGYEESNEFDFEFREDGTYTVRAFAKSEFGANAINFVTVIVVDGVAIYTRL